MTLNLPGGSTLQCDPWLWDDMPLNSPKRPPYWNSTPGFNFDHSTAVDVVILHQSPFYPNRTTLGRKKLRYVARWRISTILDFRDAIMGSLKSPCATSYRLSIDTIALNCLVFEKIAFFAFWRQTDRQTDIQTDQRTDGQHRCTKPLSLSRAAA